MVASGECVDTVRAHQDPICSAVFSTRGHKVLTASEDGTARIFSVCPIACTNILRGHEDAVTSIVSSPDDQLALTG